MDLQLQKILETLQQSSALTLRQQELLTNAIEGQERELALEAALERVRTVAMGMKKGDDLLNVCEVLFKELRSLDIGALRNAMINIHDDEKRQLVDYDYSDSEGKTVTTFAYDLHPIITRQVRETRAADDAFIEFALSGEELNEFRELRVRNGEQDDHRLDKIASLNYYFYSIGTGSIGISTFGPINADKQLMLKRFRNVFSLSYQRYIDISNAEAQTREARIEAALEKVRGKAMAMHSSDDISATMNIVFAELKKLGIESIRCGVCLLSTASRDAHVYAATTSPGGELQTLRRSIVMTEHPSQVLQYESWLNQENYIAELKGEELKAYYRLPFFYSSPSYVPPETYDQTELGYYIPFSEGLFYAWTKEKYSDAEVNILQRFKAIIDLTFRRYLDLTKAEAQAREAQIETALERVRTKAMGMHRSEDLALAVGIVFEELDKLRLGMLRCGIGVLNREKRTADVWTTLKSDLGSIAQVSGDESMDIHPLLQGAFESWLTQRDFSYVLEGDDLNNYYKSLMQGNFRLPESQSLTDEGGLRQYYHCAVWQSGGLFAFRETPFPDEAKTVMKRFADVFTMTYTRFLDLQKAEAQTREAQIEAALERVRSRTMAMQHSDELKGAAALLFQQIKSLGVPAYSCGYNIWEPDDSVFTSWMSRQDGSDFNAVLNIRLTEDANFKRFAESRRNGEQFFVLELSGERMQEHYRYLKTIPEFKAWFDYAASMGYPLPETQFHHVANFSHGNILFISLEPCPEFHDVFKRFATVFDQTYTRFLDLQKAEAQARESQIETSLERVRSRTLAMQKSDELAETAAVLFRQLIMLGVEPNRLYIAIIRDESGNATFWITDEDGTKVNLGFEASLPENPTWSKMFEGWKAQEKSLVIDMQGKELEEYFAHLTSLHVPFKGGLSQQRRVQTIAYFSQGFLGIASPTPESEEALVLLERFAGVFNLTYTRFNDLTLAEAHALQAEQDLINLKTEKKRAEEALTELRATQEQLIQQEKLASLGQLTAGIAHEIKNPLNFVNNFSDVSIELVAEAVDELKKANGDGRPEEVLAILGDVHQNLKKINEHGKRADGIVKSMLQHSRGSGGKLDPADMNAVINEYVNLAYHGMRAGKNPINVDIQLELDASLKAVPLITEDFSRVVVNLCQNAFDAMREKLNSAAKGYSPRLTVRTSRCESKVQVEIEDNGPGIPDDIKNKILQPFFTTKKGTQGTGLGLSITNDIIKAHRGELRIDSNGTEGARFVIVLPA
ncbi:MAG TPA: ATP-binding protein [Bacteroidota bacterium]|jgi:signal transduction histidine kinase|nr:ATP-binding protein [Bacteroidota bacterium]